MSAWPGSVGSPVEGPPRCTLTKTQGVSVMAAKPICSIISENPGPEVTVKALAPAQTAPWMAMEAASSSSIWMKMPPRVGILAAKRSTTSVDGVMGYPAANRAPAASAPSQHAWSPSMKWTPVRTPLGSACIAPSKDGEIRTIHAAEIATTAFLGGCDVRRVVTGGVESGRKSQDAGRAKLHAKPTPLTAFHGNRHKTFGHEEPSK